LTGTRRAWDEPETELVADGIHRIPLPLPTDGLKAVNVYVIETDRDLVCIDGGWAVAASRQQFERLLRGLGHHPADVGTFLVTHAHRDHYSQAAALRSEFGNAQLWLGREEAASLRSARRGEGLSGFLPHLRRAGAVRVAERWAAIAGEEPDPQHWGDPDHWLAGDTPVPLGSTTLSAIHTPGHTAGHYVFADLAAGLLFAGDHVLPSITPSIGFHPRSADSGTGAPLGDFLSSLRTVRAMPDLRLLPAHGAADSRTHRRVDELLDHHRDRLEECVAAVHAGARSAWDVACVLPWTRRRHRVHELDTFNAGLAVLETQLHVQLLASQGVLRRVTTNGVDHFAPGLPGDAAVPDE
jgi:glyoxylase-like metal-dependent hydrolase (beta-lactamase superfamily II)